MGFCIKCGAEYQEGAQFCTKCGTRIEVMGNNAEDDAGIKGRKSDSSSVEEEKNAETVILPISKSVNKSSEDSEAKARNDSVQNSSHQKNGVIAKKSKAPLVLLIAAPVVLIALVLIVGITSYFTIFSQSARDRREVNKQLKLAERYLDELDYEQAIAAYKAVLEIDPNNAEALAALNDVYEKWAESDPASADKIYEDALTYYASLNERAGTDVAATYIAGMEQKKSNSNGTADNTPATTEHNLTVTVVGANETGAISGAEITISGTNISMSDESDGSGTADFAGISDGSVKISVSAPGYNSRELEVSISGSDLNKTVALVPEISGDDAMVLLTWNGDHDLDLCAFNSSIKEYVSIGHPMDSEGNVFLYADHGADLQYEVIYIHNASAEMVRTFYVADAGKARNGDSSSMESDGVSVYVYNNTGLTYSSTADASQSAPLWCPCYYYAGVVYDQGDYIYDTTEEQYTWISFDEKDAYTADATTDDGWKQAYLELLNDRLPDDRWADSYSYEAALIYINDDDIPEFVITNGNAPTYMTLFAYVDGSCTLLTACDTLEYYPKGELFYDYYGIDEGGVGVSKWDGEKLTQLWRSGLMDTEEWVEIISDEEAEKQVSKYFDRSKSTDALEDAMSIDEMIAYLSRSSATSAPTDTPTTTGDWKQAYSAFINRNSWNSDDMFSFLYIDKDDVPELVVENVDLTTVYIYKNGAVTKYEEYSNWGAHGVMHDFYEGYISSSGAGDAGPLDSECPYFYSLDPVFDESLDSYCENEYDIIEEYEYETGVGKDDHERATEYFKNGKEISYEQYKSETDRIMNKPCKVWANGSKAEVLKQLDK